MPDQIKTRYLRVQYALFLANENWGAHRKAAQQYICQQYPTHEAQEILRWITPLENFIDGKKGARFSKTNTNQPYTEIRSLSGRRYELLNTPEFEDLMALDQVLPADQVLPQDGSLILEGAVKGLFVWQERLKAKHFLPLKKIRTFLARKEKRLS